MLPSALTYTLTRRPSWLWALQDHVLATNFLFHKMGTITTHLIRLLWGLDHTIFVKWLEQYRAHTKETHILMHPWRVLVLYIFQNLGWLSVSVFKELTFHIFLSPLSKDKRSPYLKELQYHLFSCPGQKSKNRSTVDSSFLSHPVKH